MGVTSFFGYWGVTPFYLFMDDEHKSVNYRAVTDPIKEGNCYECFYRSVNPMTELEQHWACGLLVSMGSAESVSTGYTCDKFKKNIS